MNASILVCICRILWHLSFRLVDASNANIFANIVWQCTYLIFLGWCCHCSRRRRRRRSFPLNRCIAWCERVIWLNGCIPNRKFWEWKKNHFDWDAEYFNNVSFLYSWICSHPLSHWRFNATNSSAARCHIKKNALNNNNNNKKKYNQLTQNAEISSSLGNFVHYLLIIYVKQRAHIFHAAPSHPPHNKGIPIDFLLFVMCVCVYMCVFRGSFSALCCFSAFSSLWFNFMPSFLLSFCFMVKKNRNKKTRCWCVSIRWRGCTLIFAYSFAIRSAHRVTYLVAWNDIALERSTSLNMFVCGTI